MNKAELIDNLAKTESITKVQATQYVNYVFESIKKALKAGAEVRIPDFGVFAVTKRAARDGRNPRTGEKMKIAASKQAKFRPASKLKEAIN